MLYNYIYFAVFRVKIMRYLLGIDNYESLNCMWFSCSTNDFFWECMDCYTQDI